MMFTHYSNWGTAMSTGNKHSTSNCSTVTCLTLLQLAPWIVQSTPATSASPPPTLTGSTVTSLKLNSKNFLIHLCIPSSHRRYPLPLCHFQSNTFYLLFSIYFSCLTFCPIDSTCLIPPFPRQVFLIIRNTEDCNFTLMHSSNLDWS
jgi:hypothetical protein